MPFVASTPRIIPPLTATSRLGSRRQKIKTVVDGAIGRSVHPLKNKSGAHRALQHAENACIAEDRHHT